MTAFATPGPGPKPTAPAGPTPTGPRRAGLEPRRGNDEMPVPRPRPRPQALPQRCTDERPHGPHPVPARRTWTAFQCAGRPTAAEQARELDEAFGLLTS